MQSLISNLKQQSVVSILIATIVSNTLYSLWYQIPQIAKIIYGSAPIAPPFFFGITIASYLNTLVAVIGLSLLISKKGALSGFVIGGIVAIFFSINALVYSFVTYPMPEMGIAYGVASSIGLLLFYGVPGTLLGYFRKN